MKSTTAALAATLMVTIALPAYAWTQLNGEAQDIGVGANGAVWVIGTDVTPGGYGIHRWTGSGWQRIDGGGVRISVDPRGRPWVVNSSHTIFSP